MALVAARSHAFHSQSPAEDLESKMVQLRVETRTLDFSTPRDLGASRAFHEKLGFEMVGGDPARR